MTKIIDSKIEAKVHCTEDRQIAILAVQTIDSAYLSFVHSGGFTRYQGFFTRSSIEINESFSLVHLDKTHRVADSLHVMVEFILDCSIHNHDIASRTGPA